MPNHQPAILIDLTITYETVVRIDPDSPEETEEKLRKLRDLLTDLGTVLGRA